MASVIPSIQDIYNKLKSSIFSNTGGELEVEKDPFAQSMSKAQSDITFDIYKTSQDAVTQTFAQSATDEAFLNAIAFDRTRNEIQRKQAQQAKGQIIATASSIVDVPAGTAFITSDGELYESLITRTCNTQTFLITAIERTSNFAICTLVDHNLPTNFPMTVAGVNEVEFNGLQDIQVVDKDTFKYPNAGLDEVATGTITGSFFGARIDLQSLNASDETNKTFTDNIELAGNVAIDDSYITFNGITGGVDIESLDFFKARLVEYLANPENKGNILQHQSYTKQNTEANYVYFFQSEDDLFIYLTGVVSKIDSDFNFTNFTVDELNDIEGQFLSDNQLLLGVEPVNLSFSNPTFVNIDINIVGLSPATIDMRNAINLVLKEYLSLLQINFYLLPGKPEVSEDKIKSIVNLARDSNGTVPLITSLTVTGAVNLDEDIKKPILGVVSYA